MSPISGVCPMKCVWSWGCDRGAVSPWPPETRSPSGEAARVATAAARRRDPPITMSTMKSERRPDEGADPQGPPREVMHRLAGLLPEGALDEAVRGLNPEELSGPGGLLS